jgi:integrase
MALYSRPDSPFYWLWLERPHQRGLRENTRIPVDAGTPERRRENRRLAENVYSVRMADLARDRYDLPVERPRINFAAYRAWYLAHVSAHKRSDAREASVLRQLGATFDAWELHSITRAQILEWRTNRAEQVAASTVNREADLLRHVLSTAIPEYLEANPAGNLRHLRVPERDLRLLEPDEEARLLARADPELRGIVVCALDTLMRLTTVASLKRAQDHRSFLTVLNPKTRGYQVPVSRRLRRALDALPSGKPQDVYFPSIQRRTPMARAHEVMRRFAALCSRAGVPYGRPDGITFHTLRHTGASRMLGEGVDVKTVAEIGGWKNLVVLERYLHPLSGAQIRAVEAVSGRVRSRFAHAEPKKARKRA